MWETNSGIVVNVIPEFICPYLLVSLIGVGSEVGRRSVGVVILPPQRFLIQNLNRLDRAAHGRDFRCLVFHLYYLFLESVVGDLSRCARVNFRPRHGLVMDRYSSAW